MPSIVTSKLKAVEKKVIQWTPLLLGPDTYPQTVEKTTLSYVSGTMLNMHLKVPASVNKLQVGGLIIRHADGEDEQLE